MRLLTHTALVILIICVVGVQSMHTLFGSFGSKNYTGAHEHCIKSKVEVLFKDLANIIRFGTGNYVDGPIIALNDLENNTETYVSKSKLKSYIVQHLDTFKTRIVSFLEVSKVEDFVREIKQSVKRYQCNIKECRLPGGDPLKDYTSQFMREIKTAYKENVAPIHSNSSIRSSNQSEPSLINYPNQNYGYGYQYPSGDDDSYSQASGNYGFDESGRLDSFINPDDLDGR